MHTVHLFVVNASRIRVCVRARRTLARERRTSIKQWWGWFDFSSINIFHAHYPRWARCVCVARIGGDHTFSCGAARLGSSRGSRRTDRACVCASNEHANRTVPAKVGRTLQRSQPSSAWKTCKRCSLDGKRQKELPNWSTTPAAAARVICSKLSPVCVRARNDLLGDIYLTIFVLCHSVGGCSLNGNERAARFSRTLYRVGRLSVCSSLDYSSDKSKTIEVKKRLQYEVKIWNIYTFSERNWKGVKRIPTKDQVIRFVQIERDNDDQYDDSSAALIAKWSNHIEIEGRLQHRSNLRHTKQTKQQYR